MGETSSCLQEARFEAAWYMGELGFEFKPSHFLAVYLG